MPRLPLSVLVVPLVLAGAAPTAGGPCLQCATSRGQFSLGWRDDRPLSPAGVEARAPRTDADEWTSATRLAVVWEEGPAGASRLGLATSDDGGCTWSTRTLTSGAEDDRWPDVYLSVATGRVAVVFVRQSAPWLLLSADGGQSFAAPVPLAPGAAVDPASPPRIAGVPLLPALHLHIAWGEGGSIRLASSTAGGDPGSWRVAEPLPAPGPGPGPWSAPDVAVDSRSSSPGSESAVSLVAAGALPGDPAPRVYTLRSLDSGLTFHGDPADPASRGLPRAASASDVHPAASPALDGSDDGSGVSYVWNAVAWINGTGGDAGCKVDARAEEGTGPTVISEWNDVPATGDLGYGNRPADSPALSIVPNPLARPPDPELHLYLRPQTALAPGDVLAYWGILDAARAINVVNDCGPYRLTGEYPPRPGGEVVAGSVSADEDLSHELVAWADSREGPARIWYKTSDTYTDPPTRVTATPRACADGGGILVSWTPPAAPPHCDVALYHVDSGFTPGSHPQRQDAGPGATSAVVHGPSGTTLYVVVKTVDEACHEAASLEASAVVPVCPDLCPNPVGNSLKVAQFGLDGWLVWDPAPVDGLHDPATSYDVYRSDAPPDRGYSLLGNSRGVGWLDPGAADPAGPIGCGYYRVVSRNACGTSGDEPPR